MIAEEKVFFWVELTARKYITELSLTHPLTLSLTRSLTSQARRLRIWRHRRRERGAQRERRDVYSRCDCRHPIVII